MIFLSTDFEIIYDESCGGVSSLVNKKDAFSMNWVEGNAVWGTVKNAELKLFKKTPYGSTAEFSHKKFRIIAERSLKDEVFTEKYTFTNISSHPVFTEKGEIGIYTTFNDSYDSADICMTNRCNTHIWCGGNTAWVNALKMGVSDINLGLILREGSIDCYSVERDIKKGSNDRGDFLLHPSAFSLEPGESCSLIWDIFFHKGISDFEKKLDMYGMYDIIIPRAKRYTVFENEKIEISVNKKADFYLDGRCIAENTKKLDFLPKRLGEHKITVQRENFETYVKIYVSPFIEKLVKKRVNYIAGNQQYLKKGSVLDGAYLVYDTKEKTQYFDNGDFDRNASRERIGMALLLTEYLKRGGDKKIKNSLEKYKEFFFLLIIDEESGEVFNAVNRDNTHYRLYNYSWAVMLLVDLYKLEKDKKYLFTMVRAIKRFYNDGGKRFYPNGWFLSETVEALKEAKMEKELIEISELYKEHIENMVKTGTSYPPHEVNYEQTIVTPGATMITQYILTYDKPELLKDAEKQINILSRFNGVQPDYHLYETAIRHWDGYWFGKARLYGDTFPHYWSSLTGLAYLNYYKLTKNKTYLKKAEDNLRNCLSLFFTDGGASCAYIYPFKINGIRGEFFDDFANDQDFALYYCLKYFKK